MEKTETESAKRIVADAYEPIDNWILTDVPTREMFEGIIRKQLTPEHEFYGGQVFIPPHI